ncbi:uncharacterized protein BP5553_08213 [Venustampulla echinocandica]|uniref:Uncharacterized protein n=1 Tax=Venustampulla echinocandica TaxID=2656787 RepID=A0A370TG27_9HELO|nr:uncharacterized protein BP5553_08213 [Venustampulla echinocandica]RDL33845.1 hypothetical protein BP5553_08213 [Venustampulla echinocandica]
MNRSNSSKADDRGWVPMTQTRLVRTTSGSYIKCQPAESASQDTFDGRSNSGGRRQSSVSEAGAVQDVLLPADQRGTPSERYNPPRETPRGKPSKNTGGDRHQSRENNTDQNMGFRNSNYILPVPLHSQGSSYHKTPVSRAWIPRTVNEAIDSANIQALFPHTEGLSEKKVKELKETCKRYRDDAYETAQQPGKANDRAAEQTTRLPNSKKIRSIERDAQAAENRQHKTTPDKRKYGGSSTKGDGLDKQSRDKLNPSPSSHK